MLRTIEICAKNVIAEPANVIVVPTSVSTVVIPDLDQRQYEYAAITIQNVGANRAYYAFGQDCDNVSNYHGYLEAGVQLNCFGCRRVTVFSVGGTSIAPTIFRRHGL